MNFQEIENKHCKACNKIIKGRTDKKYCNDYCRNIFNNQLKSCTNNLVRNINHLLSKNRRVLERYFFQKEKIVKIKKEELLHQGFYFKYHTQTVKTKSSLLIYFCYDYLYFPIHEEWIVVMMEKQ